LARPDAVDATQDRGILQVFGMDKELASPLCGTSRQNHGFELEPKIAEQLSLYLDHQPGQINRSHTLVVSCNSNFFDKHDDAHAQS
jgi:hypothetical protein